MGPTLKHSWGAAPRRQSPLGDVWRLAFLAGLLLLPPPTVDGPPAFNAQMTTTFSIQGIPFGSNTSTPICTF